MKADFAEIKRTTDLVVVVQGYGIELRREGKDWRGRCPFHADNKRPNFIVSPDKGLWRCPACNVAGNAIQFVAKMDHLTEREAALKLLASVPGVQRASVMQVEPEKVAEVSEETRSKLLERVAGFYAKTLRSGGASLEYLKSRGLEDAAMQESFLIGYCNGTLRGVLPESGQVVEQLKTIGVLNEKGNEVFYKRVVIPVHDAAGNVVSLYGRRLDDEEPRHLYLKGPRCGVFNAVAAKSNHALILVESILDALSLWKHGVRNVVALGGTDGWRKEHEELIRNSKVTELYIAFDNDEAGRTGAERLRALVSQLPINVYVIGWPEGVKDANTFFPSRNASDFEALLKAAKPQPALPQSPQPVSETIALTAEGFAVNYEGRKYEMYAVEKPGASRLRATVKARVQAEGMPERFVIDTLDFYLMRSKRSFITEAARLFGVPVEVAEGDVNRLTLAAERYVQKPQEEAVKITSEADQAEGMRMARSSGLMEEIQRDLEKLGIVGEETNRLLLYLAMTTRKMEKPMAVQILSSSGAGKSHLQDAVLSLCPEEDLIKLTSLTDRALFYKGEDSLKHKALAIAEVAGAEGARYALRNLISDGKLVIESTIKNPANGRLETQINTVHGPTAVFETTTQPDTDPETKSRYWLMSVDESPGQTRAIMEWQRHSHTLEGRKRKAQCGAVQARHHAFQRMLRPVVVVNPFEPSLAYGEARNGALPLRRDQPKYLNLILAVTFLHQHQRTVKHDADLGEYIETTLDDIAIANELAATLLDQSLDELSFPSRELLRLIGGYVSERARTEEAETQSIEWTRRELREAIQWTEARLRLHLNELVRLEYILPLSGRFGSQYRYQLLIDPVQITENGGLKVALKSVEELRKEANLAGKKPNLATQNGNLAGQKANLATTSQPPVCEVVNGEKPHEHSVNGGNGTNLARKNGKRIYTLQQRRSFETAGGGK